jgi:site-specific DNA-methyltransferase (adenine-specific)
MFQGGTPNTYKQSPQGRWPANLIHDGSEEVLELFPNTTSGSLLKHHKRTGGMPPLGTFDIRDRTGESEFIGDSGSAARFFYCAKASKAERDAGCENLEERFVRRDDGQPFGMNTNQYRPDGSERKSIPPRHNNHPTVKPLALMRYLCRLVTPPGGIILDPFMGSGSTGVAAELEGFRFIGIDQDKEAFDIACRRVSYVR